MRIGYFIVGYILMASQATESGQKALLSCKNVAQTTRNLLATRVKD